MPRRHRSRSFRLRLRHQRINPRPAALALTLATVALQLAVMLAFWFYPDDPPARGTLWQALWARANMPTFYPLIALAIAAPPASYLALSVPGPHRRVLAFAWALFLPLALALHGQRIQIMLQILWKFA